MSSQLIKDVSAYEVLDSRGNPTLATEITLSDKSSSISYVPAGASTGKYEALEKRDFDKKRYNGRGVLKAVKVVNKEIIDLSVLEKNTILYAFIFQLLIFIIIQFFEISSINLNYNNKK